MKKSVEQELTSLRRDLKALSERLAESVGETYDAARDQVGGYADELVEEAGSKWESAKAYGRRGREYVEDHPWQAIGMGVLVGFLLASLARRRD